MRYGNHQGCCYTAHNPRVGPFRCLFCLSRRDAFNIHARTRSRWSSIFYGKFWLCELRCAHYFLVGLLYFRQRIQYRDSGSRGRSFDKGLDCEEGLQSSGFGGWWFSLAGVHIFINLLAAPWIYPTKDSDRCRPGCSVTCHNPETDGESPQHRRGTRDILNPK